MIVLHAYRWAKAATTGAQFSMKRLNKASQPTAILLGAVSLLFTAGCSSKNYVRSQTAPLVTKTNELDDLTAKNTNAIHSSPRWTMPP